MTCRHQLVLHAGVDEVTKPDDKFRSYVPNGRRWATLYGVRIPLKLALWLRERMVRRAQRR